MKILAIGGVVPHRRDGEPGVTAVHIVLHELVTNLARLGHEVWFQPVFNVHRAEAGLTAAESRELRYLADFGIRALPPIYPAEYLARRPLLTVGRRLARLVAAGVGRVDLAEFYPAIEARGVLAERILALGPGAIVTMWSPEGVAATHGLTAVPRIAYQGDVDFVPALARARDRALFNGSAGYRGPAAWLQGTRSRLWLARFQRAHLELMRDVDVIANVTACNAEYYTARCHRRSVYVGNVWRDPGGDAGPVGATMGPAGLPDRRIRIIGHVGKLGQTGSTYGLRFLLTELMPELDRVMTGLDYEVHVIGGGEAMPALRPALGHPRLRLRGFVDDLDHELRTCDLFLLLNNAGPYQAAYTRHLVAWAMGLCLIVHENSRRAIPEIAPLDNALVGATAREVAEMVRLAAANPEVSLRVRKGGRATYERHFTGEVVARALEREIEMARARCAATW